MQKKHLKTLNTIFTNPISANIKFKDIESLCIALGATITEREGSRIAIILDEQVKVFHRPHPSPNTDKGAVMSLRKWLESLGYTPDMLTLKLSTTPNEAIDNE